MRRPRKKKVQKAKGNGAKDPSVQEPIEDSAFKLTGPVIDDETGEKSFSREDLLLYELVQLKFQHAAQAARLKQVDVEAYQKAANQKLISMQSEQEQLKQFTKKNGERLTRLQEVLASRYGVDFSKITYDDETGRITEPPPDPVETQPPA